MIQPSSRPEAPAAVTPKVVCPHCERLSEIQLFSVEGGRLFLHCPRCEEQFATGARLKLRLVRELSPIEDALSAAAEPAARTEPPPPPPAPEPEASPEFRPVDPPADHCPKCVAPWPTRGNTKSCARCGLAAHRRKSKPYHPKRGLARRWDALLSRWDDASEHNRFLAAAVEKGDLAAAGRLYAVYLAHRPSDAQAVRARDEVIRLATAQLDQAERPKEEGRHGRLFRPVVLVSFVLLVLTGVLGLTAMHGG